MGIRIHALPLIEAIKPYLSAEPKCYLIGAQDCGFTYKTLIKKYPEHEKKIKENIKDLNKRCDLKTLFNVLGFNSVLTIDINDRADIQLDLSSSIPKEYYEKADLVFDSGTLEHIFDVKKAIENINHFLKMGGVIFHMSPVSFYQHGFFNFNPSFFDSLYTQSGYKQIFRTMNISIYNPFYIINTQDLPRIIRVFFQITNKIFDSVEVLHRYNLPLSYKNNNKLLHFFNFWIGHFRLPKNLLYCCAYQKLSAYLKIPFDSWE